MTQDGTTNRGVLIQGIHKYLELLEEPTNTIDALQSTADLLSGKINPATFGNLLLDSGYSLTVINRWLDDKLASLR